jgi:imidazolonepropionase-like amidohydrolase
MFARASTLAIAALCLVDVAALAQSPSAEPTILFENVRIFDGKSDTLSGSMNVLVRGNTINKISRDPIPTDRRADTRIIAGGGRTLMPGLIDMHWHTMLVRPTVATLLAGDIGYLNLMAGAEATDTLMRGFTTVRDVGGPAFGLKRAIDEGIVPGPRIYPSGAIITVTSGHGDFRQPFEVPRALGATQSRGEQTGAAMIADSPDEVRVRVREQLLQGATQIKLTAGGGVASPHSPLDASTFTEAELRAAVEAAENWGTYVTVHAYTPISIQRAIAAGVKCIEHGHLMDEPTAKLVAEKGIWLSTQAFPDEMADAFPPGSPEREKAFEVFAGTDRTFTLAKQYKIKTAFGHPVLPAASAAPRGVADQTRPLVHARRNTDHGDRDERPTPGTVRQAQSLSWQARRSRGRRTRRPPPRRGRSSHQHQTNRGSDKELRHHHEGWKDLQELFVRMYRVRETGGQVFAGSAPLDAAGVPRYGGWQERFENECETDDDCERQQPGDVPRERDCRPSPHAGPASHSA